METGVKKISVVIPCYNSESLLEEVVGELVGQLEQFQEADYEIILVSDASPDGVFDVICRLAKGNPRIRGLELARNFGQHAALMAGYRFAGGDVVVSMDDDGQAPPEDIRRMLDKLAEGYDVVYADYPVVKQSLFRRIGSGLNKMMMELMLGKPKELTTNSFYACRRYIIEDMLRYTHSYPYLGGLVLRSTKHIAKISVEQRERKDGHSGYSLMKLIALWANGFTAFSIKPLRIATVVGGFCALGGFVYGVFVVIRRLLNPDMVLGYSSMMAMLVFIGGMIMLMLGMIGEYVGRMYISINNSPQYVIRRRVNAENEQTGDSR